MYKVDVSDLHIKDIQVAIKLQAFLRAFDELLETPSWSMRMPVDNAVCDVRTALNKYHKDLSAYIDSMLGEHK